MISVLEAMSEAMRMRASCGALHLGVKHAHAGRALAERGIYLRRNVSLLRAQYPACGPKSSAPSTERSCACAEYCRAVLGKIAARPAMGDEDGPRLAARH